MTRSFTLPYAGSQSVVEGEPLRGLGSGGGEEPWKLLDLDITFGAFSLTV